MNAPTFELVTDEAGSAIQANTLPWLRARRGGLGASDAPAILGLSPWTSQRDVYLAKTSDTITDEQTEAMEFGHLMEQIAVQLFESRHSDPDSTKHRYLGKIAPAPGLIRSTAHPLMLASLDSVIVEDDGQRVPGQIKNVSAWKAKDWRDADDGVPDHVRVQVLQEVDVFGADHGWVLPIFGGNTFPEPIRVDRDPDFLEWYYAEHARWWAEYVDARHEPPVMSMDDLSEVWSASPGLGVDLTPEGIAAARQHVTIRAQIKELEALRDKLALTVKNEMGEATEAWDRTDRQHPLLLATWRQNRESAPTRRLDVDALLADHPEASDLLDAYMVEVPPRKAARPFLSKA